MNSNRLIARAALSLAATFAFNVDPQAVLADPGAELTKISLEDLPPPPEEIRKLLESARVSFQTGAREVASSEQVGHPASASRRLDGETKYTIDYSFKNRCRWRTLETGGTRELVITVHYRDILFGGTHTVWLRRPPDTDRFWQSKLVLHELDHVKISSDPTLAKRFAELLRENDVLRQSLERDVVVNQSLVNRFIDQHARQLFDQVTQLIAIRYRELDSITDHGIRPLPGDSPLMELLRPTVENEPESE